MAFPVPAYIASIGHANDVKIRAGYLDVSLYDGWQGNPVDPTGVADSTAALQKAIDDAYENGLVTYLPSGTYLVSDTLERKEIQVSDSSDVGEKIWWGDWGTPYSAPKAPTLVGAYHGPRPVIRLANSSPGFDDQNNPKAVLLFMYSAPDAPDDPTAHGGRGMSGWIVRGIEIEVGNNNPGAIGLIMRCAQNNTLEDVKIDATGGYAGVQGFPAVETTVNLEVIGGRYGLVFDGQSGISIAGLTLHDQTDAAILSGAYQSVSIVGFDIRKQTGPAIVVQRAGQTAQLAMMDGTIEVVSGSGPAIQNTSDNAGKDLYLRNVWIHTPGSLVRSGTRVAVSSGAGWDHVREYANTNWRMSGERRSWNLIEGGKDDNEIADIARNSADPPADLVSRHVLGSIPTFEDADAFNVLEQAGIVGDGVTDVAAALQAVLDAHEKVFLPRGDYVLGAPLVLRAHTKLFGVPCMKRVRFYTAPSWAPGSVTCMVRTVDDADATTYMANIKLYPPGEDGEPLYRTYIGGLEWRAGRHSIARQVGVELPWVAQDGVDRSSHARRNVFIHGHGGGRFYGLMGASLSSVRNQHPDFRDVLVDGTTEPLTFYGMNVEKGLCDTDIEFRDAANIRVIGTKTEAQGDYLWVVRSQNVLVLGTAWHGGGGESGISADLLVDGSSDLVFATLCGWAAGTNVPRVLEVNMPNAGSIDNPDHCSYYRRGQYDDAIFDLGPASQRGIRLACATDDAEERLDTGAVSLGSSDLEFVRDTANQLVGMRFIGMDIPYAAVIENAWLEFTTDETGSEPTALTIQGQAADNAATFTSATGNISGRPRTAAAVNWTPGPWDRVGAMHQSADFAAPIQEIVDRPGWQSGNALALLVSGSGRRVAVSYDGRSTDAPLLRVAWHEAPAIAVSTTNVSVYAPQGSDCPDTTFQVWNSLGATLEYRVVESTSKFSIWPTSNTSTGSADKRTHTIHFTTANLLQGTYERSFTVADDGSGARNGPITIAVHIAIGPPAPVPLVRGALWRYRRGTAEASAPASAWRQLTFDDSAWAESSAPIGYGAEVAAAGGTVLGDMRYNYTSVFVRRTFDVVEPLLVSGLDIEIDYDDGFILWINGREVARVNVAGATGSFVPANATASTYGNGTLTLVLTGAQIPELVAGPNVIAAQVFNASLSGSSDCVFDAALDVVLDQPSGSADNDQNNLADDWEQQHLSDLPDLSDRWCFGDPDGDGLSNLAEFIAGTDPRSEIGNWKLEIGGSGGQIAVSFQTIAATGQGYDGLTRHYALEERAGLDNGAGWQLVPGYEDIVGSGQTVQYTTTSGTPLVFRARVWLE